LAGGWWNTAGFKKLIPKKTNVWRDGNVQVIDASELVPGDIVDLTDGDQVPADIAIIMANECKVDNSSLTGESEPQDRSNVCGTDAHGGAWHTAPGSSTCMTTSLMRCSWSCRLPLKRARQLLEYSD
jgi:magnesium-transporting ATPase (P-type)